MWRSSRASLTTTTACLRLRSCASNSPFSVASARAFASTIKRPHAAHFELLVPAVAAFQARFGHFLVPYSFPIAADDTQWPAEARGINIGRRLHAFMTNLRHRAQWPHIVDGLEALGFPVFADYKQLMWEKRTLAALRVFYRLHGHSLVPVSFKIPSQSADYPIETWELDLGKRVATLRDQHERLSDRARHDLTRVAFSFDVDETHWQEKIRPALQSYHQVYSHLHVPRTFVVPQTDAAWPISTRGLRLGLVVHNMRTHGAYRDQLQRDRAMLQLENDWEARVGRDDTWHQRILPALRVYAEVYGTDSAIPVRFTVPSKAPWPEAAWRLRLGETVGRMRTRNHFQVQRVRDAAILTTHGVEKLLGTA